MFTKLFVAAAALSAAVVMTAPAQADTNIGLGIGFGFGGGYHDDDYDGGYDDGYDGGYITVYENDDGISCSKAKKIVRNHGFHKVHATDCSGKYKRFKGVKSGDWYRIKVNPWGTIVDVDEINEPGGASARAPFSFGFGSAWVARRFFVRAPRPSAHPGEVDSLRRKGFAPNRHAGANPAKVFNPGSGPGQAFGGICSR